MDYDKKGFNSLGVVMAAYFNIQLSEDKKNVTLDFLPESGVSGSLKLSPDQLSEFIRVLGIVRWAIAEGQVLPDIMGAEIKPAYQTRWAIQEETLSESVLMAFQHPGYGPVGFVIPPDDVKIMIKALQAYQKKNSRKKRTQKLS